MPPYERAACEVKRQGLTQNKEAKQILRKMIEAIGKFGAAGLVAPQKDLGG